MIEVELKSFQKRYSKLNTNLQEQFPRIFKLGILVAYNSELSRGYVVEDILKTTEDGTIFKYIKIKDSKHESSYKFKVNQTQSNLLGDQLIDEIETYKLKYKKNKKA